MAVEIYSEPELEELRSSENPEELEKWKVLVEELGMEGQQSLVAEGKETPSPYMNMNNSMICMFAILYPVAVNYKTYNKSTIPVAVLREIAFCNEMKVFDQIKIWYDDVEKDPVVVGYIKDSSNATLHLIARFGDEVLPFEVLREKALARLYKKAEEQFSSKETLRKKVLDSFNRGADSVYFDSIELVPWYHKRIDGN